eukprot:2618466-Pyramimonas_sp.AAC.1
MQHQQNWVTTPTFQQRQHKARVVPKSQVVVVPSRWIPQESRPDSPQIAPHFRWVHGVWIEDRL